MKYAHWFVTGLFLVGMVFANTCSGFDLVLGGNWLSTDSKDIDQSWGGSVTGRVPIGDSLFGTLGVGYRDLDMKLGRADDLPFSAGILVAIPLGDSLRLTFGGEAAYNLIRGDSYATASDSADYSTTTVVTEGGYYYGKPRHPNCKPPKVGEWSRTTTTTDTQNVASYEKHGRDFADTWTAGPVANVEVLVSKDVSIFAGGGYQWDLCKQEGLNLTGWTAQAGFIIHMP